MKKFILGINLILLLGISSLAQNQKDDRQVWLQSGTTLEGQLETVLDVKKSKPGDQVVLKTTKSIKQNGEVVVPKGTRLIGRVTEVQQKTKGSAGSKLNVVFERLQGKNLGAPLSATIVSITQAAAGAKLGDTPGSDVSGSSSSSGSVSSSSGGSGGGLLGGVTGTVGGVVNTTTQTVGGVTNTAGQTLGTTTQTLGGALKGISLSQSADVSANGSTTISSNNNNLRLEKGVIFQLRLNKTIEN